MFKQKSFQRATEVTDA